MERKNWKVIKIIDDYNIVINGGKDDLLKAKDVLEVIGDGEPLIDPDTGEKLGTLNYVKAKVYIKDLYDKFSVCVNSDVTKPSFFSLEPLKIDWVPERKPLNVNPEQITGYDKKDNEAIQIGDLVRKSL